MGVGVAGGVGVGVGVVVGIGVGVVVVIVAVATSSRRAAEAQQHTVPERSVTLFPFRGWPHYSLASLNKTCWTLDVRCCTHVKGVFRRKEAFTSVKCSASSVFMS